MSKRVRVNVFKDKVGEWRWNMVAPNGNRLACSGEGYARRIDCLTSLCLVLDVAPEDVQYRVDRLPKFRAEDLRALRLHVLKRSPVVAPEPEQMDPEPDVVLGP